MTHNQTLENKAYDYAQPAAKALYKQGFLAERWLRDMIAQAYIAGHEAALRNQWHDAADYPPIDEDVLVDYPYEYGFAVAYFDGQEWYITESGELVHPTRWMTIPKLSK